MDFTSFEHNPLISGGIVLMLLGSVIYYLKQLPGRLYNLVERFFIIRMEILDEDEAYHWMQVWLADKLHDTLSISVITKRNHPVTNDEDEENETQPRKPAIYFVPAVGTYFFWYKGRAVTLSRDRQENASASLVGTESKSLMRNKESFTLRIFSRDKALARELIEECRAKALPEDGKMDVRIAAYGYWALGTRIKPRSLGSVVLDGNQAEELLADMKQFLGSYDWYQQVGVPYRRGYLLHGPPGNGKTSAVKALAGELGMSVYLLMLSDPDMNDNRVNDLMGKVADRSILLLEDIDCAFIQRTRANAKEGLTFSGLLNAIDGVASPEGRLIVMTTNHIDRLDPALIRPGRADVKLEFGNATSVQAGRLFERFYPAHAHRSRAFADQIEDRRFSMATIQDYLMLHRDNPDAAVQNVGEMGALQLRTEPADAGREPSKRNGRRQASRMS